MNELVQSEDLILKANSVYKSNFDNHTRFERALFFSWYCGLGDCTFCYMSILKDKISDPKKAKRRISSILAETFLCKELGWKIEFVSGGYGSYSLEELRFLIEKIHQISGDKIWLNIGTMPKEDLQSFMPHIAGYAGTVETTNWILRKKVCPSKRLEPILKTFMHCEELGLGKAITIILGLGETLGDFSEFERFVKEHNVSRVTFYALNPHPGTPFSKSPEINYYELWIAKARIAFPKMYIIAGAWSDKTNYYSRLLTAGANAITKLPSLREFGSKEFVAIETEIDLSNRVFEGSLTKLPKIDWAMKIAELKLDEKLSTEIKQKIDSYIRAMTKKNSCGL